ncbi:MAG: hypothetical protein ABII09_10020 [Planctomycetota bacterium]
MNMQKNKRFLLCGIMALVIFTTVGVADYKNVRSTIDGGGGTSGDGQYGLKSFVELSDSNQSQDEFEVLWGLFGASGESSGGPYNQIGSVPLTDGNEMSGGEYTVTEQSEALPDCIVSFIDFVRFVEYWLWADCSELNRWCDGADLNHANGVDFDDLDLLADEWLLYCPYIWPLR